MNNSGNSWTYVAHLPVCGFGEEQVKVKRLIPVSVTSPKPCSSLSPPATSDPDLMPENIQLFSP